MNNFVIPAIDIPTQQHLSEYLTASINAFSDITGIPVTFFSEDNDIIQEFQPDNKICRIFETYSDINGLCRHNLASAGQFTSRLGEPYIFLCKAGLANIAISLIVDGTFMGYFIAGPIVMGELRTSTINNFATLNDLNETTASVARVFAKNMKAYEPNSVSKIALLFYNCIITSVSDSSDYNMLRNQYSQQNQINEDIQKYKKEQASLEYPYDLEQSLIQNVTDGQILAARTSIDDIINKFSILEAGDLEAIKAKCLWLFAIIIQISSKNSNNLEPALDTDLDVINRLSDAETIDDLRNTAIDLIDVITKNMISSIYDGNSQIISKAIQFVNSNYMSKINLNMIEKKLHVNASYFSTLFKQEMGISFTQYINNLRIARSCELLVTTNLSIIDISMTTGFDDQSYFTKVFKHETGMTPKQYRSSYSYVTAHGKPETGKK